MTSQDSHRTRTLVLCTVSIVAIAAIGLVIWSPSLQQLAESVPANLRQAIARFQAPLAEGAEADVALWQWLAIAFSTVFVAEMGDKTQLATMLMSARGKSPWGIFFGSASALVAASLVSVTLGGWLSAIVEPEVLQAIAGISFTLLGLYILWAELTATDEDADLESTADLETAREESDCDGV
ncbi:TMEM165/GDT1 family protein [Synechococcus sp. PCC 7336]|uniref:TMEM165/GDT1 family protein n=1 Tax=Synechococcus sp. PCC 7336 TaxID=195250 RepID=UPI00034705E6|nr:TMEM165/GDT1 family protein [Synechococcus sp. PCC 7336]